MAAALRRKARTAMRPKRRASEARLVRWRRRSLTRWRAPSARSSRIDALRGGDEPEGEWVRELLISAAPRAGWTSSRSRPETSPAGSARSTPRSPMPSRPRGRHRQLVLALVGVHQRRGPRVPDDQPRPEPHVRGQAPRLHPGPRAAVRPGRNCSSPPRRRGTRHSQPSAGCGGGHRAVGR